MKAVLSTAISVEMNASQWRINVMATVLRPEAPSSVEMTVSLLKATTTVIETGNQFVCQRRSPAMEDVQTEKFSVVVTSVSHPAWNNITGIATVLVCPSPSPAMTNVLMTEPVVGTPVLPVTPVPRIGTTVTTELVFPQAPPAMEHVHVQGIGVCVETNA